MQSSGLHKSCWPQSGPAERELGAAQQQSSCHRIKWQCACKGAEAHIFPQGRRLQHLPMRLGCLT